MTLAVSLVSASPKPFFLPAAPAIPAAAGAGAAIVGGNLVVTSAAGATLLNAPLALVLAGKAAVAGKLVLAKLYLDERAKNQKLEKAKSQRANRRG